MAKVPFRYQATEYDCLPTSFINGLIFLYEREQIPPLLIQKVYMSCLDVTKHEKLGRGGTSDVAQEYLTEWLDEYTETVPVRHRNMRGKGKSSPRQKDKGHTFTVAAEYYEDSDLTFAVPRKASKTTSKKSKNIQSALKILRKNHPNKAPKTALIFSVTTSGPHPDHAILGLSSDSDLNWIYCFDPYLVPGHRKARGSDSKWAPTTDEEMELHWGANIKIRSSHLTSKTGGQYRLGPEDERGYTVLRKREARP